jgi:thioredoxin-related protein
MKVTRLLPVICIVLAALSPLTAADTWLTDYAAARAQASKENKKLLLDFTGSDWCGYCIKLDKEVLGTPEFAAFAQDYILVRLDYPRKKTLPTAEKEQNAKLKAEFKIEGYPTLIVASADGHELNRVVGYEPGSGAVAYLAGLRK